MTEAQIREWLRSLYIGREGIKSTMANVSLTRVGQIIELETVHSVRKYNVGHALDHDMLLTELKFLIGE